ncbi:Nme6 [Columba guinea]|nr:Nme6 [Columba guinea]
MIFTASSAPTAASSPGCSAASSPGCSAASSPGCSAASSPGCSAASAITRPRVSAATRHGGPAPGPASIGPRPFSGSAFPQTTPPRDHAPPPTPPRAPLASRSALPRPLLVMRYARDVPPHVTSRPRRQAGAMGAMGAMAAGRSARPLTLTLALLKPDAVAHPLVLENAIPLWRSLMGPTKVFRARNSVPDSIRGAYGLTDTRNTAHGSDSPASASREIAFFFPEFNERLWYEQEEPRLRRGRVFYNAEERVHCALGDGESELA